MSRSSVHTLLDMIRTLIVILIKVTAMAFAFACKVSGIILLRTGETIEKMISR